MSDTALFCLGGNAPESPVLIAEATSFLSSLGIVEACSGIYRTSPEYEEQEDDYYNVVLRFITDLGYENLLLRTKGFEAGIRAENASTGRVNLDIDIVVWNGTTLRPRDAASSYFRKGLGLLGNAE